MSSEDELAKQIQAAIADSLRIGRLDLHAAGDTADEAAQELTSEEKGFWAGKVHREQIRDMQLARRQREEYADKTFKLVCAWIFFLAVILLAQASANDWHPFSDKVLIVLVSSMTINLIGTLVIVLKYIFHDQKPD